MQLPPLLILDKIDYKTQNTKHKQFRDLDVYELSYAQLGHKNGDCLPDNKRPKGTSDSK